MGYADILSIRKQIEELRLQIQELVKRVEELSLRPLMQKQEKPRGKS